MVFPFARKTAQSYSFFESGRRARLIKFGVLSVCGVIAFSASLDTPLFSSDSFRNNAYAQTFEQEGAERGRRVQLTQGKADIISTDQPIADVVVANPDIIELRALQANRLSIIGLQLGSTNILLLDRDGEMIQSVNIDVSVDERALRRAVKALYPNENVTVKAVGDEVVLSGSVSSAAVATSVRELAMRYTADDEGIINMIDVEGEQQVMINVRVMEVSRSILNELGIETELTSEVFDGRGSAGFSVTDALGLTIDPTYAIGNLTYSKDGFGPLSIILRALERDGMVNTLAEPNLTAVSGENARFLAGGEFPIPTSRDRDGNIVYEYRPFGVSLSFKPVVLSNDRISLQVLTEVSEVSSEQTLQLPGITVPSFNVRRAETTIELGSGGSLMLAGLIESQAVRTMNEVPGLRKLPVIGDLISSESFRRNESELIIMMTAYTVKPFAENRDIEDSPATRSPIDNIYLEHSPLTDILHQDLEQALLDTGAPAEEVRDDIKKTGYILD